jgi:23S rRNA (adenine2030-N6)-methyltransferase
MNYRHAFHAGNHADVFKHAALTLVLEHLRGKAQPFAVLDTHAGIGLYDLASDEAQRAGEYPDGVGRIFGRELASAPEYSQLIQALNPDGLAHYPGSPEIIRRLLRPDDRLIACELHPADFETLKVRYRRQPRLAVHHRNGYEAIGALLPPPERRGLVLIDPPFEQKDEAAQLVRALRTGLKRWPRGVFMAWYPVKDGKAGQTLFEAAVSSPFDKALRAEFRPYAMDGQRMAGGGLLIVNTPWRLDEKLAALCEELGALLGDGEAAWTLEWLTAS